MLCGQYYPKKRVRHAASVNSASGCDRAFGRWIRTEDYRDELVAMPAWDKVVEHGYWQDRRQFR
jgi:hypothetical protein